MSGSAPRSVLQFAAPGNAGGSLVFGIGIIMRTVKTLGIQPQPAGATGCCHGAGAGHGYADPPAKQGMKTSELTAVEIVRDIAERNLLHGDRLPVEAEMLAQYKISRSSLREALRLLEVQGLINIRTGPNGGTTVGKPSPIHLARTAIPYLHLAGATYGQALEAWAQTQMLLAHAAASNPDRSRVRAAMRPFMKDASRTHQWKVNEGIGFHDTIAMLSNNPVLQLMLQSIARIVSDHILNMIPMDPPLATRLVRDHEELAAAIHDGKAQRAQRLMEVHADHARKELSRFAPQRVGERIRWPV